MVPSVLFVCTKATIIIIIASYTDGEAKSYKTVTNVLFYLFSTITVSRHGTFWI